MGFIFSFLLGFGVLRLCSRGEELRPSDLFLAWGLGVGLAAQTAFYAVILGGRYHAGLLLIGSFVILTGIWGRLAFNKEPFRCRAFQPPLHFFIVLLAPLVLIQLFIVHFLPYGDWDAWSLWNFRANFLFRSAGDWLPGYHHVLQERHPWLLPHYILWGWTFQGRESAAIPQLTAFFMSAATVGLVVYGLADRGPRWLACGGGLYLISVPVFGWHSSGQYADVLAAFFFLASLIALREYTCLPSRKYALLAAASLAFLANVKTDGIVLAGLLLIFMLPAKGREPGLRRLFWGVFAALSLMIVLSGLFMWISWGVPFIAADNNGFHLARLLDLERWRCLFVAAWHLFSRPDLLGYVPFLLPAAGAVIWRGRGMDVFYRRVLKISAVFFCLLGCLYIVSDSDVGWRVNVTLTRHLFYFLPALVYLIFDVIGDVLRKSSI